jgi:PAS domain S-box-containing protein
MVIEKMTDSMFVIDQLYNIVDINPAGERFLHLSASDVFGISIQQAFANHEGLVEHILTRPIAETEIKLKIDNEDTFYDLRIVALHDPQGNISGRIIILRDITSRKKTEDELNRRLSQALALNTSIAAISTASDSAKRHQIACRQIGESLNMAHTAFAFWDPAKQSLRVIAEHYGETHNLLQADYSIPITANSAMAYSLRNNVALVIPNAQLHSLYDQTSVTERQRYMPSMLMVPVAVNNQVIGTFCLDIPPFRDITSDEVAFVQTIAIAVGAITGNQKLVGE